jgi:hypothetical protein
VSAESPTSRSVMASPTGRPAASDPAPTGGERESWKERLLAALPLFVVGVVCVASAVFLYLSGAATTIGGSGTVHLRPWVLFVALGITGISAGTIALFAEEPSLYARPEAAGIGAPPSTPSPAREMPEPRRSELPILVASDGLGSPAPAGVPAPRSTLVPSRPPVTARVWDESDIAPAAPGSDSKDSWDESSEEFVASASVPAPPEVVLHQLDELEVSLRKKPTSSGPH